VVGVLFAAAVLRDIFAVDNYFSVRQNLIYSSYRSRGREYKQTPHIDRKKRQRSKDYKPQEWITLVLRKPISGFSEIFSKGQRRASFVAQYQKTSGSRLPS
jgi:hypothetical protein